MPLYAIVGLISSLAASLLLGGGGLFVAGWHVSGIACGALGALWLGTIQGSLLRMIGAGPRMDPPRAVSAPSET
jgi:hypothetical protein